MKAEFKQAVEVPYERFDFSERFKKDRPLLSHYTTVRAAESIIANNQVWLSNPLFMNDIDELTFGLDAANEIVARATHQRDSSGDTPRPRSCRARYCGPCNWWSLIAGCFQEGRRSATWQGQQCKSAWLDNSF